MTDAVVTPTGGQHHFGSAVARFDARFDLALDRLRGRPVPDAVFHTASAVGDWSMIWHVTGGVRGLTSPQRAAEALRLSGLLGVESLVVNQGVKRLFSRVRPLHEALPTHVRRPSTSSFPRGHASSAFFAASLLTQGAPAGAPLWFAMATVVAVSRPYVRLHHASDIVAGAALGLALGAVARLTWPLPSR